MPLEEMSAFFAARVDGYEAHMLTGIEGIAQGYACVAGALAEGVQTLLDLGCGTGLELGPVFERFPDVSVTGIDLTQAMLDVLAEKYADKRLSLICGSYFDVDFGKCAYDTAISFETMHHFTHAEKLGLYQRLHAALREGGLYVEADYMVDAQAEEDALFAERDGLLAQMGARDGFWHFDVPCTVDNQVRLLREAGFSSVRQLWRCGNTVILAACV